MPSLGKFIKAGKGQSTVELAFAFPLLMLVFFGVVEFSHLFYTQLTAQNALRDAARFMVTGQGYDATDPAVRAGLIHDKFCDSLIGTGVSCPPIGADFKFTCGPVGGAVDCVPAGGNPGDTVTVTATLIKPWFTGLFGAPITLTLSTTWQNEQYL